MSGILGQIGWKSETTWNTGVTVDKFSPLLDEAIKNDGGAPIVSRGVRAGRRVQHVHKRSIKMIGGPVKLEFGNTDIAVLLKHLFGAVTTTGAGPYTHTYTPGTLNDKSLTVQVGRPDSGATVRARTFTGVKIPSWEIAASADQTVVLTAQMSAAAETGATSLAAASYTSGWKPFVFTEGSVTKGGSAITVDRFSITGNSNLRTNRKAVGGTTVTKQLGNGFVEVGVTLEMDFEDLTMYDHFLADDALTLVIALNNGTQTFTVTTKGYLVADSTPNLAGPEILKQPLAFVAESATSDADAFTAVLVNSEASAA